MAAFMRRVKGHAPPEGWELVESTVEDYERQMREAVAEDHEGKRKNETTWRIHRIHFEKNRFIYDLMYKRKALSRELYDYMVREKIADGGLIAKWRKPGYENLCSMLAIQKGDHNFGTTSLCRVPIGSRSGHQLMSPDVKIGCISCASGDGINGGPIWWNTPITAADLEKKKGKKGGAGAKRPAEEPIDEEVQKRLASLAQMHQLD